MNFCRAVKPLREDLSLISRQFPTMMLKAATSPIPVTR